MRFKAQLVVELDGGLKHSARTYDLLVDDALVVFKGASFIRSFLKPEKVVVGKRVLRVSQGTRYFLCRFPDPTAFTACVNALRARGLVIINLCDLLQQDSKKLASLNYCRQYFATGRVPSASAKVQASLNSIIFRSGAL
ncbi:hypothetical protein ACHHYP_15692 [Achlya hypogyna]|uniref:Uncharacterized protein n=1 Tax=Achlya hypogyna TaxID=1202772 RepID=A0A1V9YA53_ACHHY|nr:hypothetical protein ACHHYP_15692 [Achlya hypogyna]